MWNGMFGQQQFGQQPQMNGQPQPIGMQQGQPQQFGQMPGMPGQNPAQQWQPGQRMQMNPQMMQFIQMMRQRQFGQGQFGMQQRRMPEMGGVQQVTMPGFPAQMPPNSGMPPNFGMPPNQDIAYAGGSPTFREGAVNPMPLPMRPKTLGGF